MTDTDTVDMLRDTAQRYAAEQYSFAQRRTILAEGSSDRAWRDYAEFGWLALRLPEADGGIGADATATGALMEVVGARLLMEPVLASAVLGTGLVLAAANAAQRSALLPALADGSLKLSFACEDDPADGAVCQLRGDRLHGAKLNVLHGDVAGRLIVSARDADAADGLALCLVDPSAAGVHRRSYRLIDGRGAATLRFDGARVERLEGTDAAAVAIAHARDEAAVALCAEALGVVRTLVSATCDYLKVRKQFGRTIGSNQALQHRMVEMYLLQQEVQALTLCAQRSLDDSVQRSLDDSAPRSLGAPAQRSLVHPAQRISGDPAQRNPGDPAERSPGANPAQPGLSADAARHTRAISGARAYIAAAARRVANDAVQLHGGLGITEELDISHYFRRVMVINALFGNRDEHLARFVQATP
jgi:alkylation response protein AidB-like acyl-CoA dehydrogenase